MWWDNLTTIEIAPEQRAEIERRDAWERASAYSELPIGPGKREAAEAARKGGA